MVTRHSFFIQNNPKNLDLSYKMDLDLLDCLGRVKLIVKLHRTDLVICCHSREEKVPFCSRINMVTPPFYIFYNLPFEELLHYYHLKIALIYFGSLLANA